MGHLEFEPNGEKVLVVINGQFMTESPLIEFLGISKIFIAMLPNSVLASENEIGLYLVQEEGLQEVDLSE